MDPTFYTAFICIGEARTTKDLSTLWTGRGEIWHLRGLESELGTQVSANLSFDGELHLVHYNSKYDNISEAIADNQTDSLSVVGILLREVMPWDQFSGVTDSMTITNLKMAANELSKPRRGPSAAIMEMEVLLDQFASAIT